MRDTQGLCCGVWEPPGQGESMGLGGDGGTYRSRWQPETASTVHRAETGCAWAAACRLLEEGQACPNRQKRLGTGDTTGLFIRQGMKAKQDAWEKGRHAWRIGPTAQGEARMRQ